MTIKEFIIEGIKGEIANWNKLPVWVREFFTVIILSVSILFLISIYLLFNS
jgi:hypothetical protein